MSDITREEIAARIEASEARTDTKFAQMMGELHAMRAELGGKLDTIGVRVDSVEKSTHGTKATIIVTGIAVVGLVVAIMAFGSQSIGIGFSASEIATTAAQRALSEQATRPAPQATLPPSAPPQAPKTAIPDTDPTEKPTP